MGDMEDEGRTHILALGLLEFFPGPFSGFHEVWLVVVNIRVDATEEQGCDSIAVRRIALSLPITA